MCERVKDISCANLPDEFTIKDPNEYNREFVRKLFDYYLSRPLDLEDIKKEYPEQYAKALSQYIEEE